MTKLFCKVMIVAASIIGQVAFSAQDRGGMLSSRADERLFTLYAAFNACGYDLENVRIREPFAAALMSLPRQEVRKALSQKPSSYSSFCDFLYKHQKPWFYYTAYTLALSEPPEFKIDNGAYKGREEEEVYGLLAGLDRELAEFHRKAGVAALWKKQLPRYQDENAYYITQGHKWLEKTQALIGENVKVGCLIILPNLLETHQHADVKHVGQDTYILVGPRYEEDTGESTVVHEYLHLITRPILQNSMKNVPSIERAYSKITDADIRTNYSTPYLWIDETFVRVLTYNIVGVPWGMPEKKWLDNLVSVGFSLAPEAARSIDMYLKTGTALSDTMPKMLRQMEADASVLEAK